MEAILIVLVGAIVAVLLVGIAVFFYDEGRKQRDLRRRPAFGIGRGHTGARSAPEQELEALAHNPGSFTLKPLPSVQAARFSAEWRRVQQRFTDDPSAAIADAHSLARDVMGGARLLGGGHRVENGSRFRSPYHRKLPARASHLPGERSR